MNKFISKNKLLMNRFIIKPDQRSNTLEPNKVVKLDPVSSPRTQSKKITIGNLSSERIRDKPSENNDNVSNNIS